MGGKQTRKLASNTKRWRLLAKAARSLALSLDANDGVMLQIVIVVVNTQTSKF